MHPRRSLSRFALALVLATPIASVVALQKEGMAVQPVVSRNSVAQTVDGQKAEADRLQQQGIQQYQTGHFEAALQSWKQALSLYRQQDNCESEIDIIGNIADVYFKLGKIQEAEQVIRKSINDFRRAKNGIREQMFMEVLRQNLAQKWKIIAGFGRIADIDLWEEYKNGNISWGRILDISRFNLFVSRQIGDLKQEMESLHSIGWSYRNLGKFYDAIDSYQQAAEIAKLENHLPYTAFLYIEIGIVYTDVGLYKKSIESFQNSLSISSKLPKPQEKQPFMLQKGELRGFALTRLGMVHIILKQYDIALDSLQKALNEDYSIELHNTLLGIGIVYFQKGDYSTALKFYQRSLDRITIGDPSARGEILNKIGLLYVQQQNYLKAFENFQEALISLRSLNSSPGESITLSNLAFLLDKQNQPELAITFYKESVNITESIRQNLRKLTIEEQRAYTESVANTYRALANLLLSQGRVLEAQQVLELLKIQELRDYTRDTRTGGTTEGSPFNPLEKPIPAAFNDKIALGSQLTQCEQTKCAQRSQLIAQREAANDKFTALVDRLKKALRDQEIKDPAQLQNDRFTLAAQKVILANPNVKTVLVYPLVLDDKLWLVWGSQAGKSAVVFDSKEIPVSRKDLSAKVGELQDLLSKRGDPQKLQQVSQQLYQWLIAPIRRQLDENGVQQIVFSLDRATRYIPMAALHDGNQFLIENFAISTILTAEIDTQDKLSANLQDDPVLGLGLTQSVSGFPALTAVRAEIDGIIRTGDRPQDSNGIYPGLELFDLNFTETALREKVSEYRVLHIATHGKFVPGNPEDSFLVMGDGKPLSIPTIRSMTALANTHLVVLSACETGKGGLDKEGLEVAGIGHYFLLSGAKSVMASLWLVNDPATSVLMREFYSRLSQGNISKAEALRQVQIEFLRGKLTAQEASTRSDIPVGLESGTRSPSAPIDFSHPYYWAPFILIGNSL